MGIGKEEQSGLSFIDGEVVEIGAFTNVKHFNHVPDRFNFLPGEHIALKNGNKFLKLF